MYLDTLQPPSLDRGICLGIGPGFVHFWVGIRGRRRIDSLPPPTSCPWILPRQGLWELGGMGHAPVTSVWVVVGPQA